MKTIKFSCEQNSPFHGGVFQGWGTSLCWWANRIGDSKVLTARAAELFFSQDKGIGLNIVRYNIGGGDDPSHRHIQRTDSEIPGYLYEQRDVLPKSEAAWEAAENSPSDSKLSLFRMNGKDYFYDWNADENQRRVLEEAIKVCGDEIIAEAFSNSPPYFMTVSGCSCGNEDASKDNLRADCYAAFAAYLGDVAKHFRDVWNISFQSIAPMNEPETDYWHAMSDKQEGCHFHMGKSQSDILIALKHALSERGLEDVLISASDETSIDRQILSLQAMEPEALKVIARIDVHTYGGQQREALRALALEKGKNLWMSEVDGGETEGENAGEMGAALWLSKRIVTDLNGLRPSAWILWQVIDRHICADGYHGKQDLGMADLAKGYWGLAIADHDKEEILLTKKYYAMGQFSRFIRPGFRLIAGDETSVAAYDSDSGNIVVVIVNTKESGKAVCLNLQEILQEVMPVFMSRRIPEASCSECVYRVRTIRTSGTLEDGENMAELEETLFSAGMQGSGVYETELRGNSVTTFLFIPEI